MTSNNVGQYIAEYTSKIFDVIQSDAELHKQVH